MQFGTLPNFLDQWRDIASNGLCLIYCRVTIFGLGVALHYFVISGGLGYSYSSPFHYSEGGGWTVSKWWHWMIHSGVGFYFDILLFLSIMLVYIPYSIWSDFISVCIYILISDRYRYLFNKEIILFKLISKMLIYIFVLLSVTVAF